MKVKELIEKLKELPQDYHVTMADYALIKVIHQDDEYGDGVVILSDYTDEDQN